MRSKQEFSKKMFTCQKASNGAYRLLATLLFHCLKGNLNFTVLRLYPPLKAFLEKRASRITKRVAL